MKYWNIPWSSVRDWNWGLVGSLLLVIAFWTWVGIQLVKRLS